MDDINKSGTDNDAALIITLNTTGFTGLTIRWDYKSELATSFDFAIALRRRQVDPGRDNRPSPPGWATDSWYSVTLDLSAYTAINNQTFVQLRLDDLEEGPAR
jgi:hypothetical protein